MVRGKGDRTIVFVHHNDVVTVEDYDRLRPLAFSPDELEVELKRELPASRKKSEMIWSLMRTSMAAVSAT